jgi:anti-anti-sigma factor
MGASGDSFRAELRKLAETTPCNVLVYLAGVTQLDSSGIGALVESFLTLTRSGGSLKMLNPTGNVREVLEVTHLTNSLPTYTDEPKALASFPDNVPDA